MSEHLSVPTFSKDLFKGEKRRQEDKNPPSD